MTDGLQKLFNSPARVKLLRLFLFNARQSFSIADAALRARTSALEARREILVFARAGVVQHASRGKGARWTLSPQWEYVEALQNLLLNAPRRAGDIAKRLRGVGTLKLVILAGIFIGEWDAELDIFIVGDRIKEGKLKTAIRRLEAELGKELRYALLSSENFFYRLNMNDKLVRDVLDYSHRTVFDKLNIGLK